MVLPATNQLLTASAGGVPCPESLILGSADKSLPIRVSLSDLPKGQAGKGEGASRDRENVLVPQSSVYNLHKPWSSVDIHQQMPNK